MTRPAARPGSTAAKTRNGDGPAYARSARGAALDGLRTRARRSARSPAGRARRAATAMRRAPAAATPATTSDDHAPMSVASQPTTNSPGARPALDRERRGPGRTGRGTRRIGRSRRPVESRSLGRRQTLRQRIVRLVNAPGAGPAQRPWRAAAGRRPRRSLSVGRRLGSPDARPSDAGWLLGCAAAPCIAAAGTSRRSKSLPHQAHSDQSMPTSRLQFGQTRLSRVRHDGQMIHSSSTRRSQRRAVRGSTRPRRGAPPPPGSAPRPRRSSPCGRMIL